MYLQTAFANCILAYVYLILEEVDSSTSGLRILADGLYMYVCATRQWPG